MPTNLERRHEVSQGWGKQPLRINSSNWLLLLLLLGGLLLLRMVLNIVWEELDHMLCQAPKHLLRQNQGQLLGG